MQDVKTIFVVQCIVIVVVLPEAGILIHSDIRVTLVYLTLSIILEHVIVVLSDVQLRWSSG